MLNFEADSMQPKATSHHGTCSQCAGIGDVITIEANPIPLSLCPFCLAAILATASGTRRAIVEQWRRLNRKRSGEESKQRAELQRKAQADLERASKPDKGNGRGS